MSRRCAARRSARVLEATASACCAGLGLRVSVAAVIFDCDGVLFRSEQANVAFYNAVLDRLGEPELNEEGRGHAHRMATPQIMEWLFGEDPHRLSEAMTAAYATDYAPFLARLEPVPELFETLRWLRAHYRTAMATNRACWRVC